MVQNTQIVRKKLYPIDQKMNINHSQGLLITSLYFLIQRRVSTHLFYNRNYLTKEKSSIQSIRELLLIFSVYFAYFHIFSVSIFLQNIGTKINVSIWSFHIFWSVHPWRKQVDHAMKLFADQIVVYHTVQIIVSSLL